MAISSLVSAGTAGTKPFSEVDELLGRLVDEGLVAGVSACVSIDGSVQFEGRRGNADLESGQPIERDTIFRIYSMTKPVTAVAIMILVDDGRLDLLDPVSRYVEEFANLRVLLPGQDAQGATETAKPMAIIDLLRHSSGMSNSWPLGVLGSANARVGLDSLAYLHDHAIGGLTGVARRVANLPLQFQPGAQWYYSMAPDIAGLVVERVTGRTFGEFLRERVFSPLRMDDTDFWVPREKAQRLASMYARPDGVLKLMEASSHSPFLGEPVVESGAAGLLSTLSDYGRFASMLACRGKLDGERVLSERSTETIMSSSLDPKGLADALIQFMPFGAGMSGAGMAAGLGGAVLVDPLEADAPGTKGEYMWGGAASSTFFVAPTLRLAATLMVQLFPAGGVPLLSMLKTAVYRSLSPHPGDTN